METIEVDRLSNAVNMPVIKLSYRTFPGVLVQGDTLSSIYHLVNQLYQLHAEQHLVNPDPDNDDGFYDSKLLLEIVGNMVREYEVALKAHGIPLPYSMEITKDED